MANVPGIQDVKELWRLGIFDDVGGLASTLGSYDAAAFIAIALLVFTLLLADFFDTMGATGKFPGFPSCSGARRCGGVVSKSPAPDGPDPAYSAWRSGTVAATTKPGSAREVCGRRRVHHPLFFSLLIGMSSGAAH